MGGLVDLPEGVFGDYVEPCIVCTFLHFVVVSENRGIIIMFNKVEVTSQEEVNVVRDIGQELELSGAASVVVCACG